VKNEDLRTKNEKLLERLVALPSDDPSRPLLLQLIEGNNKAIERNDKAIVDNRIAIERNYQLIVDNRAIIKRNGERAVAPGP
jgi:hypothetical protein